MTTNSQSVVWSRTDGGSGLQGSQYRIDGGGWSSIVLGTVNHAFSGLSDGSHTVDIRTWDLANNYQTRSVSFTVDTVNPTLVISDPANLYVTNSTSVTVFWNGTDATSGIQGYQYALDSLSFSGTTAPIFHLFSGLSNGNHYVNIKALDKAGLSLIKRVNFTIDNVAPVLTISAPASGAYLGSSSVTATWSATDATTSISGYQYRIDGGSWSAKGMSVTNVFTGVADGSHTIDIRAFDAINNLKLSSVTFKVDVTAPTINILSPVEHALVTSVVVTWNGTDATSGIQGYQYSIDNGTWSTSAMTLTNTFTGQADGGHFIQVKATDRSGNFATASVHLKLDTSAPVVAITSPASGANLNSSAVTVNWTGSDAITAIQGYEYQMDATGWSPMTGAVTFGFTGLADGLHTVYVKAFDLVNNTATTSLTFRVDTVKPGLSITAPAGGSYSTSSSVRVNWTGSDSGSGIAGYQYRIDSGDWSAISFATIGHTFTGLSDAVHTVDVCCYDNASNVQMRSVSFTVDTVDPILVIDNPANHYVTNSTSVTFYWNGTDATAGLQGYQYQIDGTGYSATVGDISHVYDGLTNGVHRIDVKAIDKAARTTVKSVNVTVDNVAPVLTINAPAGAAYLGSSSVTATWSATDATTSVSGYQYRIDAGGWSPEALVLTTAFNGVGRRPAHHLRKSV